MLMSLCFVENEWFDIFKCSFVGYVDELFVKDVE